MKLIHTDFVKIIKVLHELDEAVDTLQAMGMDVSVSTDVSKWREGFTDKFAKDIAIETVKLAGPEYTGITH